MLAAHVFATHAIVDNIAQEQLLLQITCIIIYGDFLMSVFQSQDSGSQDCNPYIHRRRLP